MLFQNKPFADDGERQIMRYCDFMAREYGEGNYLVIYLSAEGSNPTDKSLSKDEREKLEKENKFLVISYPQIRDWVNNCIEVLKETGAEQLTEKIGQNQLQEYCYQFIRNRTPLFVHK